MVFRLLLGVGFVFSFLLWPLGADEPCWNGPNPCYVAQGLVNSADYLAGELAPGSIATLFGTGLSYDTYTLTAAEIAGGMLPTSIASSGVHVLAGNLLAPVLYVSPKQINFIVPSNLLAGPIRVQVVRDALAGPPLTVNLKAAAPALFQLDARTAIAQRPDGSLYTEDAPARPGDWVTLYAEINYGGRSLDLRGDATSLALAGLNDTASSIRLHGAARWQICADDGYRGRCAVVARDAPNLTRFGLNNRVSSIRRVG